MKKLFTGVVLLTLCFALAGFGQAKKWQFVKVFPDTTWNWNLGIHGAAVDPLGRVWISAYGVMDSLPSTPVSKVRVLYVFNPNGTQAAISGIKIAKGTGINDTLFNSMRGMHADAQGNIVATFFDTYYRFDYKTGAALAKVAPTPGVTQCGAAFTSDNEMVTGPVAGGGPVNLFSPTFTLDGTAIPSAAVIGVSRQLEVSKDGNDIYYGASYTPRHGVLIYHSDNGTLGPYALKDSLGMGFTVESLGWNPKDTLLYVDAGNVDTADTPLPPAPYSADVFYAFNVKTKQVKDSIAWNHSAYPYDKASGSAPRLRTISFSPSGDTAYIGAFNFNKAAMQMFVRKLTSVEPVPNVIPSGYTLSQNYPNPFNPTTEIQFSVVTGGRVSLKVYDVLGQEIATLVDENLAPGTFKTKFDASKLSSGTYIYRLVTETTQITKKMMLVK